MQRRHQIVILKLLVLLNNANRRNVNTELIFAMNFYQINPQTAAGTGDGTVIIDINARPSKLAKLEMELNFWPVSDLVSVSFVAYACTERLAEAIKKNGLTGVEYEHVDVVDGDYFQSCRDEHSGEILPKFLWLKVTGQPCVDDFGLLTIPTSMDLIVSEKALALLKSLAFEDSDVFDFDPDLSGIEQI